MATTLTGVIRGHTIELPVDAGFEDGELVNVTIRPHTAAHVADGDGLKHAFGGWSDEADALDEYLEWNREARKQSRSGQLAHALTR